MRGRLECKTVHLIYLIIYRFDSIPCTNHRFHCRRYAPTHHRGPRWNLRCVRRGDPQVPLQDRRAREAGRAHLLDGACRVHLPPFLRGRQGWCRSPLNHGHTRHSAPATRTCPTPPPAAARTYCSAHPLTLLLTAPSTPSAPSPHPARRPTPTLPRRHCRSLLGRRGRLVPRPRRARTARQAAAPDVLSHPLRRRREELRRLGQQARLLASPDHRSWLAAKEKC